MHNSERRESVDLGFEEEDIKLAELMIQKVKTTLEFLYFLMLHKKNVSYTVLLLSADKLKLEHLLTTWKRKTDILVEIDKKSNVYILICQNTDKEGGKKYGEILISNITMQNRSKVYCVQTQILNTAYTVQEVIFTILKKYIHIKSENKHNEVCFTELKYEEYKDVIYNI
ncbi:MAG: Unknown protein [uncultured Sulfurovum sp.]|uniref:Uncharacterized protein n=1 Tax=uncultured Sulfurovum sp. TaxID=269237 RepID=A0A6S6U2K3_9BACT|nr:MAG: Unknown protein [uncultured Sulfurovum sp.]